MGSHESSSPPSGVARAANALRRIVRALRVASHETIGRVTGAQLFVLREVAAAAAPPSIAEIAARTATDASSVSVVVSRLVAAGLAARHTSASDARRAEIAITAKGRALLRKAPAPAPAKLLDALAGLPDADLRALAGGLESLVTAMGIAGEDAPMFFEEQDEADSAAPTQKKRKGRVPDITTSR